MLATPSAPGALFDKPDCAARVGCLWFCACTSLAVALPSCAIRAPSDCTAKAICADLSSGSSNNAATTANDGASNLVTDDGAGDNEGFDADAGGWPDSMASDGAEESGGDVGTDAPADGAANDADAAAKLDGIVESGGDATALDGTVEGGIAGGLVAFYRFDETSDAVAADASGNGRTATMQGATFAPGIRGNSASFDGSGQYVNLPSGIVSGLTSFSIATWVKRATATNSMRIFDFGTGTSTYMFSSPESRQFAISLSGQIGEKRLIAPGLSVGIWHHLAITLAGTTGTLYIDGSQAAQDSSITLSPASLGTTTQNWLGRSQYSADPYLSGQIDEFRIYGRALTAAEVQQLYQQHL